MNTRLGLQFAVAFAAAVVMAGFAAPAFAAPSAAKMAASNMNTMGKYTRHGRFVWPANTAAKSAQAPSTTAATSRMARHPMDLIKDGNLGTYVRHGRMVWRKNTVKSTASQSKAVHHEQHSRPFDDVTHKDATHRNATQ